MQLGTLSGNSSAAREFQNAAWGGSLQDVEDAAIVAVIGGGGLFHVVEHEPDTA